MCDLCNDKERLDDLRWEFENRLFIELRYCPVCGENLQFVENLRKLFDIVDSSCVPETVEIDGRRLVVEREKPKVEDKKTKMTPINMAMDLEKIDISREVAMLNKISFDEKFPPEVIKDSVERAMRDKGFL